MKSFYLILILVSLSNSLMAQNVSSDTIAYGKSNDTYYFYQKKKINENNLKPFLIQYRSSNIEYKKYNNYSTPGSFIILIGVIAGIVEFTRLNKDPFLNPYSITLFSGCAVGIPLKIISFKHLKKSVQQYNKEILVR